MFKLLVLFLVLLIVSCGFKTQPIYDEKIPLPYNWKIDKDMGNNYWSVIDDENCYWIMKINTFHVGTAVEFQASFNLSATGKCDVKNDK